jgi:hypothetical protein
MNETKELKDEEKTSDEVDFNSLGRNIDYARPYIKNNEVELRANYGSLYIAIIENEGVVDYDSDLLKLSKRVFEESKHKYRGKMAIIGTIDGLLNSKPAVSGEITAK